jgi:hypothetical protein
MPTGTHFLTRKKRIFIMVSLISSFFIISPILIFYTTGYTYDFKKHEIKETGVINIEGTPNDMSVELNNIKLPEEKLPLRIANRSPGTYKLKLSKDGYYPWEKDIIVESKKTTYIKNIDLFRKSNPQTSIVLEKNVINTFFSPTGKYVLEHNIKNNIHEISLITLKNQKKELIYRNLNTKTPKIQWSPFHDHFVIISEKKDHTEIFLYNTLLKQNGTKTIKIAHLKNLQWKQSFNPGIFIQEGQSILSISQSKKETLFNLPKYIDIWHIDSNTNAWYFDNKQNNIIFQKNNKTTPILFHIDIDIHSIIHADNNVLLATNSNSIFSISVDHGNLNSNIVSFHNMTNYTYNYLTDSYSFWTPYEFWNLYYNGTATLQNRSSLAIQQIYPLDTFGQFAIVYDNNTLHSFQTKYIISQEILENFNSRNMIFNTDDKILYYVNKSDNTIYTLEY